MEISRACNAGCQRSINSRALEGRWNRPRSAGVSTVPAGTEVVIEPVPGTLSLAYFQRRFATARMPLKYLTH
jgi:hypothetical protein